MSMIGNDLGGPTLAITQDVPLPFEVSLICREVRITE